jgi:hypothetical protein
MLSAGRDINLNANTTTNTTNIYPNPKPWNASDVDFEALSDGLNNCMAQAFATKLQVESLMYMYMRRNVPLNCSAYITADDTSSVRFFDGKVYKRVDDPEDELGGLYDTCYNGLDVYSADPKNRFDLDFWCDERHTTYDAQRELLANAKDKQDRYGTICNGLKRCAPEIQKVIQANKLEVE